MRDQDKEKLLQALARLNRNPDFQVFKKLTLEGAKAHETELCVLSDNPARHQGAVQVLSKILEDLDNAEQNYLKFKGQEVPLPPESSF